MKQLKLHKRDGKMCLGILSTETGIEVTLILKDDIQCTLLADGLTVPWIDGLTEMDIGEVDADINIGPIKK